MTDLLHEPQQNPASEEASQTAAPASVQPPAAPKSVTIQIPRINTQALILGVIALVTVFQTVQLYGLKTKAAGVTVNSATKSSTAESSPSTSSSSSGSDASLPTMVGGC